MKRAAAAGWAAVSDFDGTITTFDVGDALLLHCGRADRAMIAASYAPGVRVEDFMREAFSGARLTAGQIEAFVLRRVKSRPGFPAFAGFCGEAGIPLEIVSGGIDLYAEPFFRRLGLKPRSFFGRGRVTPSGVKLAYPFLKSADLPSFKASRVRRLRRAGRRVVFFGDGPSDFEAARLADRVYAAGRLLKLCRAGGVAALPLTDFRKATAFLRAETA